MGRVNIEERFFAVPTRVQRFADLMGWDAQQAAGCLTFLWHDSQAAMETSGTEEDIVFWSRTRDPEKQKLLIAALSDKRAHFIEKVSDGAWKIRGNKEQITNHVKNIDRAAKGGRATREKWRKKNQEEIPADDARLEASATSPPQVGSDQAQFNAIQCNSIQGNAGQCNAVPPAGTSLPSRPPAQPVTDEDVERCKESWRQTLRHFGGARTLLPTEELLIGRSARHWGAKAVALAMLGARFEAKDPEPGGFDPSKNVMLSRILTLDLPTQDGREKKFERFLHLGVQAVLENKAKLPPRPSDGDQVGGAA